MMEFSAWGFEEAVAVSMIHRTIISASAIIVFGEPYARGGLRRRLPWCWLCAWWLMTDPGLTLAGDDGAVASISQRCCSSCISGWAKKSLLWLQHAQAASSLARYSAALNAPMFVDDAERFLLQQPIAITTGLCRAA